MLYFDQQRAPNYHRSLQGPAWKKDREVVYVIPTGLFFSFLCCQLDAISSANPRVIDDSRARKLSNDLKRCTYYETCATYGLNVERVFQDGKGVCVCMCFTVRYII